MMPDSINPTITYLKDVRKPAVFESVLLRKALGQVKKGAFRELVESARMALLCGDEDEYKRLKTKLPSYAFHGVFNGTVTNEQFINSSGLVHLDIDKLDDAQLVEVRQLLQDDPHTVFCYLSPSESGLKAAFRVDPTLIKNDFDFKLAFTQVSAYLEDKGIIVDASGKDVRRVSFVSHDPELFYNKAPQIFPLMPPVGNTQNALLDDVDGLPDYDDTDYTPISDEDSDKEPLSNITVENAVQYLPEAGNQSYQEWLNVGAILHHQFSGSADGLELFDTWSQDVQGYKSFEDVADKWRSFGKYDCTKVATFRTLIKVYNEAHPEEKTAPEPDIHWELTLKKHVKKFNKNNAQVMVGGKHRIMWRQSEKHTYEFSPRSERLLMYEHTLIKTGEKEAFGQTKEIFANHLLAWAKHPDTRIYMGGVVFEPNKPALGCYNTWEGFSIEPVENKKSLKHIHKHIEKVICGDKPEMIEYFYNWCAYTFQHPDVPAGAALVLRGKKGTGKGIVGHFLRYIWGAHAKHISNPKFLVGSFNAMLADCCFLFADEAFFSGDKKHEGVLKALITEPTITIERKGVDAYTVNNYLKVLMATNEDFAVPATEDERRYAVFDVVATYLKNTSYFDRLVKICKDKEVQAAFLYEMLHREIADFRPGNIPESDGLRSQRLHSLCSCGKWFADFLISGDFADDGLSEGWESSMSCSDLYRSYIAWCDKQKTTSYDRVGQIQLSKYLSVMYPKKMVGDDELRVAGFVLGDIEDAIRIFEASKKVSLTI